MVLDVVVEVVLDVVVVAGRTVVVVIDGDTVSVVGIVTSVGAKSAEDDPQAAAKRLLSTATQATVRIRYRLAFGPGLAVDHPPAPSGLDLWAPQSSGKALPQYSSFDSRLRTRLNQGK